MKSITDSVWKWLPDHVLYRVMDSVRKSCAKLRLSETLIDYQNAARRPSFPFRLRGHRHRRCPAFLRFHWLSRDRYVKSRHDQPMREQTERGHLMRVRHRRALWRHLGPMSVSDSGAFIFLSFIPATMLALGSTRRHQTWPTRRRRSKR